MRNKLLYGLLLCIANLCFAQPATWVNRNTPTKSIFIFKQNFLTVDGKNITARNKDAIGIFAGDSLTAKECVGFTILDTGSSPVKVYAQKRDTATYGYIFGQKAEIRFWDARLKCQYKVQTDSTYPLKDLTDTISKATASTPDVHFPSDSLIIGPGFASPVNTLGTEVKILSSTLSIDSVSGAINLQNALPGTHKIIFNSTFCLRRDTQMITVVNRLETKPDSLPDLSKLVYDNLPAACGQEGSIFIKSSSITGKQPFIYNLTNNTDNSLLTNGSGVFGEVKEGTYTLFVSDSAGNITTYPFRIQVTKVGDCANTVLRPDGKDGIQSLYIPDAGQAKILNKDGEVIRQLSIPAEWDCSDSNGKPVPMGDYYLFINDMQNKVITVLR